MDKQRVENDGIQEIEIKFCELRSTVYQLLATFETVGGIML